MSGMRRSIRRLTFLTDAPGFGGAERYIVAMARAAERRGIEPHIYWTPIPGYSRDLFAGTRVPALRVTMVDPQDRQTITGEVRCFRTMIERRRPDALVINACGRPRAWMIPWLTRSAGIPAVWVHQMVEGRDHRRLRPRWFSGRVEGLTLWRVPQALRHRLAARAASAVVTLNAEDRERIVRWQGVPREKIRVIPHGVDVEQFRFDSSGRRRLHEAWGLNPNVHPSPLIAGTAVRLVAGKGIELLIEAAALLIRRGVSVILVIAGDGPQRDPMLELARRRGIADSVRFVGFVEDMPAFCSALDVFTLCSATESFGLSLAEAMACERPVIGTPTAGAMRQIEHGKNGWQLDGFSPAELADALAWMHHNRDGHAQMGSNGRETVINHFSIDLTLERTLRALRGPARERSRLRWPGMAETPFAAMTAEDLG
jgi:glycosyltransferase involved in cell wall biosynthesis